MGWLHENWGQSKNWAASTIGTVNYATSREQFDPSVTQPIFTLTPPTP
jgi:hypothetical protein